MTKRHYVMIARVIAVRMGYAATDAERYQVRALARELASAFERDNPRFNRETFLRAAGVNGAGILAGGDHE